MNSFLVNSETKKVNTYEELLCEEWFKEKIIAIANTKKSERQTQVTQRDVAIDYSRIRAKFILKNETENESIRKSLNTRIMNCNEFKTKVADLFDTNVDEATLKECRSHMDTCPSCKEYYEDAIYAFTKDIFDNAASLSESHAKYKEIDTAFGASITSVPYHPGAAKYFAEQGITVPTK